MRMPAGPLPDPPLWFDRSLPAMLGKSRRNDPAPQRLPLTAWLMLVATMPSAEPTARMKILRTLETLGAAPLREGVYLLPENEANRAGLDRLSLYIRASEGAAHVIAFGTHELDQDQSFRELFDRGLQYDNIMRTLDSLRIGMGTADSSALARVVRRQREALENLVTIDFFGSPARTSAMLRLAEIEEEVRALLYPRGGESVPPASRNRKAFFRQRWFTRTPLLPDRLAASWLIRRFIDAEAELSVVGRSDTVPEAGVSYGFEGAQFNATAEQSTYDTLVRHFRLEKDEALVRVGTAMRAIDAGAQAIPEAAGFYTMIEGARRRSKGHAELIAEAEKIFDLVYERYLTAPAASR